MVLSMPVVGRVHDEAGCVARAGEAVVGGGGPLGAGHDAPTGVTLVADHDGPSVGLCRLIAD
jgi:hypothetical protein